MKTYSVRTSRATHVLPKSELPIARQRAANWARFHGENVDFCHHDEAPGCTLIIPHDDGFTEVNGNGSHSRYFDNQ